MDLRTGYYWVVCDIKECECPKTKEIAYFQGKELSDDNSLNPEFWSCINDEQSLPKDSFKVISYISEPT